MDVRKLIAEAVGTAILVIVAVGTATLTFGFKVTGSSAAAGVAATALAFGLTLLGLAYTIGPISGAHVNPAVTIGFLVSRRMAATEAAAYVVAQVVGAVAGALILWGMVAGANGYTRTGTGLGVDGWAEHSMVGLNAQGAFATEVVLTFVFVLVVLAATSRLATPSVAGLAIGLSLTAVHLVGIPLTGTSVNPARSIGPALIVGGDALSQLWLFVVAPLLGGAIAALLYRYLFQTADMLVSSEERAADNAVGPTPATP
jgi:aquaporin Z